MNLEKLFGWVIGLAISYYSMGRLEELQKWVWKAQAKVIFESRTEKWGSPRFYQKGSIKPK